MNEIMRPFELTDNLPSSSDKLDRLRLKITSMTN